MRTEIDTVITKLRQYGRDVKWVKKENLHLTLKFLGDVAPSRIQTIELNLQKIAAMYSPFSVTLRSVGGFPSLIRPKVLWIGAEDGGKLNELYSALDTELYKSGFAKEEKPFSAHLTIGRVRESGDLTKLTEKMTLLKTKDFGITTISSMSLMKSDLLKSGPVYSVVEDFPLNG